MIWEQESGGVKRADELLVSLGESDWAVRQNAVRGLTAQAADDAIAKLLIVVREQHRDLARLNAALQVLVRTPADVSPELIRLLSHPDHEVRAYAALALGDRGDPTAIEALIAALADADANVRMNAVEALGKLRAGAAVDALIGFVDALDFELAFPAIDALGAIGDQRIAYRLLPLLRQPLYKVAAIQALAALGDEEVVQPLLDLLADPEVPPAEVATALVRVHRRYQRRHGDQHTIPEAVRALASPANVQTLVAAAAQVSVSAGGGPTLLSWLAGSEADEALVASLDQPALGDEAVAAIVRRGPSIVPLLLSRIAVVNGDALRAILEALAQLGDRAAVPALLQSMPQAEEEDLLVCFLDTLARLCDPRAYQPLRGLFGHPSARVRQAAAAAVNSLAHPNTASDLLADLADPSPLIRESNLKVAGYLGPPQCLESLLTCCGDADERVRRAAIEALPIYDDPRVLQRLVQAVRTDTPAVRAAAAVALSRFENAPAATRLLAGSLQDGDVWVRYFAIRSLIASKAQGGLVSELIQLASDDPAMQVRLAAIEALGACGALALPMLVKLSYAEDSDLAGAALAALGASGQAEAMQRLVEATLLSQDTQRRILAAAALARTGSPEAVEPLLAAALGSDERTAAEAIGSLAQLGIPAAAAALIDISRLPARREKCIDALAAMAGTAVPALAQGLFQGDLDVRRAIVEVLARIGQPAAVDVLEVALNDREAAVRHAALSALAHIRQVPHTGTPTRASEGEA